MPAELGDVDTPMEWFRTREIGYELVAPGGPPQTVFGESVLGNVVVSELCGDAFGLDRTERLVRKSSVNDITFIIQRGSSGRIEQEGRQVSADRGTGTFYSSIRPMRFRMLDGFDSLMVQVDRHRLRQVTGRDVPWGLQVPTTNVGMSVLAETSMRLLALADDFAVEERAHYARAILDLVAGVVVSSRDGRPVTPSGPEALLEQMKMDILSRLHHPDLGPADLAVRHRISLRYVHRLFGDEPPAAFIRRQRLVAALQLLDGKAWMPVAGVAARCGFMDAGTFVRAFRRYYGCTPTEYRAFGVRAEGMPVAGTPTT
jgi:AraC-like DNA-binding protein